MNEKRRERLRSIRRRMTIARFLGAFMFTLSILLAACEVTDSVLYLKILVVAIIGIVASMAMFAYVKRLESDEKFIMQRRNDAIRRAYMR